MTILKISTVAEALNYLERYENASGEIPDFQFDGALSNFTAKIEGAKYHGSIPAELAKGLWEFQCELYRAVAYALYHVDSITKLTAEQKADFQLNFEVNEGSTDILAKLSGFVDKLGEGLATGVATMDSKDLKMTVISVAVVMALCLGGTSLVESHTEIKKEEIKSALVATTEQEKTKQFDLIARLAKTNTVADRFTEATAEGARAIIKGAPDADKIKIGQLSYSREEIKDVNQRAAKEKTVAKILSEKFVILSIEAREKTTTKIWLAKDGEEFSVVMLDEEFNADEHNKIWEATRNRKPIFLEVNATIIRGNIKNAQLIKVL